MQCEGGGCSWVDPGAPRCFALLPGGLGGGGGAEQDGGTPALRLENPGCGFYFLEGHHRYFASFSIVLKSLHPGGGCYPQSQGRWGSHVPPPRSPRHGGEGMRQGTALPPLPSASADLLLKAVEPPVGCGGCAAGERPCCRSSGLCSPSAAVGVMLRIGPPPGLRCSGSVPPPGLHAQHR